MKMSSNDKTKPDAINKVGPNGFSVENPAAMLKRLDSSEYFEGCANPEQVFGSNLSQIMASFSVRSNDDINLADLATPKLRTQQSKNFPEIEGLESSYQAQPSPRRHSSVHVQARNNAAYNNWENASSGMENEELLQRRNMLEPIGEEDFTVPSSMIGSSRRFSNGNSKRRVTLDGSNPEIVHQQRFISGSPDDFRVKTLRDLNAKHQRNLSDNFRISQRTSHLNGDFSPVNDLGYGYNDELDMNYGRRSSSHYRKGRSVHESVGFFEESPDLEPAFNDDPYGRRASSASRRHSSPPRRHSQIFADRRGLLDSDYDDFPSEGYIPQGSDMAQMMRDNQSMYHSIHSNMSPIDFSMTPGFSPLSPAQPWYPGSPTYPPGMNLPNPQMMQGISPKGGRKMTQTVQALGGNVRGKPRMMPNPTQSQVASDVLLEYKASGERPTMEQLIGHVVEFSLDSHGSRFIQFKMENSTEAEKKFLVDEIIDDAVTLAAHPFGNYVIQNFLQHANEQQRWILAEQFKGHLAKLSQHPHGCRVVQFSLDIVELFQRNELIDEIAESIEPISKNNHGTHVVQKCLQFLTKETLESPKAKVDEDNKHCQSKNSPTTMDLLHKVERKVEADFLRLAVHPHSYRLVQLTIANCDESRSPVLKQILEHVRENYQALAVDQHGNFILQHMLDFGSPEQAADVQRFVCSRVLMLSQHKFGSHLVEKCLTCADPQQVAQIVEQILEPTNDNLAYLQKQVQTTKEMSVSTGKSDILSDKDHSNALLMLCKDPYANFVVQKVLKIVPPALKARVGEGIREKRELLARFAYGRHILSHFN